MIKKNSSKPFKKAKCTCGKKTVKPGQNTQSRFNPMCARCWLGMCAGTDM